MNALRSILAKLTAPIRALLSSPLKLVSAPRHFLGLTLPTRVAIVTFLVLLTVAVVVGWISNAQNPIRTLPKVATWATIAALVIIIPLVVRYMVRMWLEGPPSQFPDIDKAWEQGLTALAEQGIDPMDVPIFLVCGAGDETVVRHLFEASLERFSVVQVPEGRAPLHWYGSSDCIFLVFTELSNIGELERKTETAAPAEEVPRQSMRDLLSQTLRVMESNEPAPSATMSQTLSDKVSRSVMTQTVMPGDVDSAATGGAAPARGGGAQLTNAERQELAARITYACRLLARLREPAAPVNGLLSLISLQLILGNRANVTEIQQAFRDDLELVRRGLRIRCPAITLVTGMEAEIGFRELMRRVGVEKAKASRTGKGMHLGIPPLPDHVEAIAAHACAAFDIWAYYLFKEKDGLTKVGNPKLYALICRVRTELRERLQDILTHAYGRENGGDLPAGDAMLFGGCYFGATGNRDDLQGFVKGVIYRLKESEDSLEWIQDAKREDERYQTLAHLGLLVDGILLVVLCFLLFRQL